MQLSSSLLINESPLQVLPSLAVLVGLNEAIVLQQTHYWIKMGLQLHKRMARKLSFLERKHHKKSLCAPKRTRGYCY